jgi:hypothetical protein
MCWSPANRLNSSEAAASDRRGVSGSLIAMGVEQRGSAASLRILERQDQRELNGETPE